MISVLTHTYHPTGGAPDYVRSAIEGIAFDPGCLMAALIKAANKHIASHITQKKARERAIVSLIAGNPAKLNDRITIKPIMEDTLIRGFIVVDHPFPDEPERYTIDAMQVIQCDKLDDNQLFLCKQHGSIVSAYSNVPVNLQLRIIDFDEYEQGKYVGSESSANHKLLQSMKNTDMVQAVFMRNPLWRLLDYRQALYCRQVGNNAYELMKVYRPGVDASHPYSIAHGTIRLGLYSIEDMETVLRDNGYESLSQFIKSHGNTMPTQDLAVMLFGAGISKYATCWQFDSHIKARKFLEKHVAKPSPDWKDDSDDDYPFFYRAWSCYVYEFITICEDIGGYSVAHTTIDLTSCSSNDFKSKFEQLYGGPARTVDDLEDDELYDTASNVFRDNYIPHIVFTGEYEECEAYLNQVAGREKADGGMDE